MKNSLQVSLSYPKDKISQRFGENANKLYASQGLKGHTAYDWAVPYGTPIPNCTPDAFCYSLMNKDNPDLTKYRGVYMLVETDTGVYEVSYGHCSEIFAEVGQTYQVGDIIANVGNSGPVFVNGVEVTNAEKQAGSHAGAHLHGAQIRPVRKVARQERHAGKIYLTTSNGALYLNNYFYEVLDFNNGYNGCVSLKDFSTESLATKITKTQRDNLLISLLTKLRDLLLANKK